MGLLDRTIARAVEIAETVAPEWALKRAVARERTRILNSGYSQHGANRSKASMKGWQTSTGGPDNDIVQNLPTLRERSRDLFMGDALASGALKTIRTNEIGAGLRLNAQVDAQFLGLSDDQALEWEDTVEREWSAWADSKACDASLRCNFGELQALARLSQLMSGDVFALLPSVAGGRYDLRVQLLEADRVCDPDRRPPGSEFADILGGVEVGTRGEPVAYWIRDSHPGDVGFVLRSVKLPSWSRVPAFGEETGRPVVLHLMESDRPGQRRGVPLLAPVIEQLKQLSRYTQAELTAAVVSGLFTAAITSEHPQTPFAQFLPTTEQVASDVTGAVELGPGSVVSLAPGETMASINPSRPNSGFDPFVRAVCWQIGAGLGIPYELLIMQFNSSYSASRAALLEAWKRFFVGRAWLAQSFCQPIYESFLEEAVARGYVRAPGFFRDPLIRAAWCGAEWIGPTQGQLDPTKEVTAAKMRVDEGFSTRAKETRELTGGDYWMFHRARAREEQARKADGLVVEPAPAPAPTTTPPPPAEDAEAAAG